MCRAHLSERREKGSRRIHQVKGDDWLIKYKKGSRCSLCGPGPWMEKSLPCPPAGMRGIHMQHCCLAAAGPEAPPPPPLQVLPPSSRLQPPASSSLQPQRSPHGHRSSAPRPLHWPEQLPDVFPSGCNIAAGREGEGWCLPAPPFHCFTITRGRNEYQNSLRKGAVKDLSPSLALP